MIFFQLWPPVNSVVLITFWAGWHFYGFDRIKNPLPIVVPLSRLIPFESI